MPTGLKIRNKESKTRVNFYVDNDLLARLDAYCDNYGMTRGAAFCSLAARALDTEVAMKFAFGMSGKHDFTEIMKEMGREMNASS